MRVDRDMLEQCRKAARLAESTWERMQRIRSRAESTTQGYGSTGGGGGSPDKVGNAVADLDELLNRFDEQTADYAELALDVDAAIWTLDDSRHRLVMGLRYLDGLNWPEVAARASYAISHCYDLHKEALALLGIESTKDQSQS